MADPRVASSANAYRDWVNRRKATLDKLTALATTRPSQMLGDNIKETITMLKQSAEGGLDAYKECILAKTDRREHAKWKERAEELEQVLADSLESAATAIAVIDAALCPRTPPPPSAPPGAAPPPPPPPDPHHDGLAEAAHAVPRFHPVRPETVAEEIRHLFLQVGLRPLDHGTSTRTSTTPSSDASSQLWRPGSCATRATTR